MSREIAIIPGADVLQFTEGNTKGTANARRLTDPARSENPRTLTTSSHGSREIPFSTSADGAGVRAWNPDGAIRR